MTEHIYTNEEWERQLTAFNHEGKEVVNKRNVLILCEDMSQEMVIKVGIVFIICSKERTQKLLYLNSEYLWYFGCN